jgi:hypothetical protein
MTAFPEYLVQVNMTRLCRRRLKIVFGVVVGLRCGGQIDGRLHADDEG